MGRPAAPNWRGPRKTPARGAGFCPPLGAFSAARLFGAPRLFGAAPGAPGLGFARRAGLFSWPRFCFPFGVGAAAPGVSLAGRARPPGVLSWLLLLVFSWSRAVAVAGALSACPPCRALRAGLLGSAPVLGCAPGLCPLASAVAGPWPRRCVGPCRPPARRPAGGWPVAGVPGAAPGGRLVCLRGACSRAPVPCPSPVGGAGVGACALPVVRAARGVAPPGRPACAACGVGAVALVAPARPPGPGSACSRCPLVGAGRPLRWPPAPPGAAPEIFASFSPPARGASAGAFVSFSPRAAGVGPPKFRPPAGSPAPKLIGPPK